MKQAPVGGLTVYSLVADAEAAASPDTTKICYVAATSSFYYYLAAGGAYTANSTSVLNTSLAGNTRWVAAAGRYHYLESISPGTLTTDSVGLGIGVLAAETTGLGNVAIGGGALAAATDSDDCIAIGRGALDAMTGSGGTRDNHIAIGLNALGAFTTPAGDGGSIAIGGQALSSIVSNSGINVAIGYYAGAAISNGYPNTILGYSALRYGTSVYGNTALGYTALGAATFSGSYNTAAGDTALGSATSSEGNTAVGYGAGTATTGDYSAVLGYQASGGTTGSYNVALGASSGKCTGGSRNVAAGFEAFGGASTLGTPTNDVVAIGNEAMRNATGTPSSCVTVGAYSLYAVSGVRNNALGYYAGNDVTSGTDNCLLGSYCGEKITAGIGNVALGNYALDALTGAAANTSYHVAVGYGALSTVATPGANQPMTAVGYNALTAVTTGSGNCAFGALAGDSITTGGSNSILGYDAMSAATEADYCVAIGFAALNALTGAAATSQNGHVAIGRDALGTLSNPTSSGAQVAVGSLCLRSLTTGSQNTSVGGESSYALTTGNENCALGYLALTAATESDGCVAIGSLALTALIGAGPNTDNHVAVGRNALVSCTTPGADAPSVAVGYNALDAVTTGSGHTALGTHAGGAVSTLSGGIYLGYNAGATDTAANKLHIGNNGTKSLIEGVMTSGSEMAAVHGELRDDSTAVANDFHCVYGERTNALDDAWTVVCSLTPSATASVYTRGMIKIRACGTHTNNSTGVVEAVWYFAIANAAPTVGTISADVTSGSPADVRLNMNGNIIQVEVEANDSTEHWTGFVHVEIWAPEDLDQAITYTFTH